MMTLRRFAPFLAIPLLAIPALWPLFAVGLTASADGMLHLLRLGLLDSHIAQGMFYPRWLPDLVLGYGYPLLNFYGPAAYYVAESFHLLGLPLPQALIWTHATFVVLAGWGMYLMALDLMPRREGQRPWAAALVAATAYMYGPYLLTNLFLRGAVAEVAAQALLPWIFWSMRRVYRQAPDTLAVLLAACSLGGLAATHNITLLFLPPVLLGYLALLWFTDRRPLALRRRSLGWAALAGLLAMGISAFFWLPLVVERTYLTDIPFRISATFIAENVWTWTNFLDWRFPFEYSLVPPFQLGFVQLGLAILGFVLVRPRSAEWWYWAGVFVAMATGISILTLELWLNVKLLLIAQFPWRLLGIASVPLALFAGGVVVRLRAGWPQLAVAAGLMLVIILGQRPLPNEFEQMVTNDAQVTPANAAQFEQDTKAYGTSMASEFFPSWADDFNVETLAVSVSSGPTPAIVLRSATPFALTADLNAPADTLLHLASFSFPGWQVTLDGVPLADAATRTEEGLLAVPVPAGQHHLQVAWVDTRMQQIAVALTLLAWLVLAVLLWIRPPGQSNKARKRSRLWALAPLAGLGVSAYILLLPPPATSNLQPPQNPLATESLELLGLRTWQNGDRRLLIYPYWLAPSAPADVAVTWTLMGAEGAAIASTTTRPYFNTLAAGVWRAPGLVDDAYQLVLPPALPAGAYALAARIAPVTPSTDGSLVTGPPLTEPVVVATVALQATAAALPPPAAAIDYAFSPQVTLDGYNLAINDRSLDAATTAQANLVVRPGDEVVYTLYWRGTGPLAANYHTLLHWVDAQQQPLLQRDQLPGPWVNPPLLWQPGELQRDVFRLVVPDDAPSGQYTPMVGVYLTANASPDGQVRELGSRFALPPLKIVNSPTTQPAQRKEARFGDWAKLDGYTLAVPPALKPGDVLTVTLFYQSQNPAPGNFTQFVQLYDPVSGMAAQRDAPPQNGANPTGSWAPGERVVDVLPLQIRADTPPGTYHLQIGFYDPQTGQRVPASGPDGTPLADNQIVLTELQLGVAP